MGSSIGLPGHINFLSSYNFLNYSVRLSGIYTGSNDGAPNGVELAFLIKVYRSSFTHSILHMVGNSQFGHGISNQQVYMGYGYNIQWKNIFAEIRIPIFYKNNGDYKGFYNHLKLGYIHSFK